MTINLIINDSTSFTITETVCDSYTSPSGNYTWTSSGTYYDTIPNAAGCDSLMTINLIINDSTSFTITETVCDSYTSPSGNYTWTSSGTYYDTIPNAAGCDSLMTINLIINDSTSFTITETVCDSYTSPSGNYTWTSSGTYYDTIPNAAGCDSLMTIDLTIIVVDTSVTQNGATLTANTSGATYQWLDCNNAYSIISGETNQSFTVTANGSYAVEIIENGCTDTSFCYVVNTLDINEEELNNNIAIYPNPTTGIITIEGNKIKLIEVRDIQGQLISQFVLNTEKFNIDLSEQPKGVYFLTIKTDKGNVIEKVILE